MERIAIIDLGSNTARLLIVDVSDDGYFTIVDQLKEAPRIGEGMERDGFLKPQRIQATISVLKTFRKLCDSYGIEQIYAVATAAVRQAKNQKSFIDEVSAVCGIRLRVLSAEEESILVYRGVVNTMDIPKGIILEIGGGSTKIIQYNRRNLLNYIALPFGSITLTELYANDNLTPQQQSEKIEEFVLNQLEQIPWLKEIDPETQLIGVGGSFRNLCRMAKMMSKYPLNLIHNYVVSEQDFEHIYQLLKSVDLDKKKKIKGISRGRADILPSAFAAINAFKKYTGLGDVTISTSGLRTGLLFNYAIQTTTEKPISDVLGYSIDAINCFSGCNKEHIDRVLNLSCMLFKQLRVLHKFPRAYLRLLKVAASLHETGNNVSFYNYEKHSQYIILNSVLYGISHKEIIISAFVAANSEIEDINNAEFSKYVDIIGEESKEVIQKLGVMLRLADALDRSFSGVITGINCDILGDSVIMQTEKVGDATLEINTAVKVANDFRKVFKKNLSIL